MADVLAAATHLCVADMGPPPIAPAVAQQVQEQATTASPAAAESNLDTNPRGDQVVVARPAGGDAEQLSVFTLLVELCRKSLLVCRHATAAGELAGRVMEIGWPTDVRHIAHVTFDRFHGFLGLPVEFEPDVPRRVPSASANVFGVSTESMQCSFDARGNSVPTILLMMQRRLYEKGGLRAEGIFRINAENSQEEYVRDQLNNGIVPDAIDVHCLAGLIKAWFRELPRGVLDTIPPEQVMQCQSEEDCAQVARQLPPTEAALLDWAINLMADVVQEEQMNKMNAHNIAMVFAPNMSQMSDPLTALMYAVQVMNFLKMLILRAVNARREMALEAAPVDHKDSADDSDSGHQSLLLPILPSIEEELERAVYSDEEPVVENIPVDRPELPDASSVESKTAASTPMDAAFAAGGVDATASGSNPLDQVTTTGSNRKKMKGGRDSPGNKRARKGKGQAAAARAGATAPPAEKPKGTSIISRINSKAERVEAWR